MTEPSACRAVPLLTDRWRNFTSCGSGRFQACFQIEPPFCSAGEQVWGEAQLGCPSQMHNPVNTAESVQGFWIQRRVNAHLEHAEQLLHVGSLGFQQLVHDVSADREGRDQMHGDKRWKPTEKTQSLSICRVIRFQMRERWLVPHLLSTARFSSSSERDACLLWSPSCSCPFSCGETSAQDHQEQT